MARQYYRNPYSTRRPPERSPTSSLAGVWLLIGIFMGVGIMGLAYVFYSPVIPQQLRLGAEQSASANAPISAATDKAALHQTTAQTQAMAKSQAAAQARARTRSSQTKPADASQHEAGQRFEFYTLLPGMEVALPDQKAPTQHKPSPTKPEPKRPASVSSSDVRAPVTAANSSHPQSQQYKQSTTEGLNHPASHTLKTPQTPKEAHSKLGSAQPNGSAQSMKPNGMGRGTKQYIVQAGLFQKINEADALKARLTLQGFQPRLQKIRTQQGNDWFRVTLGPFLTESQAVQQKTRLEDHKIQGILILQRPNEPQAKT